MTKILPTFVKKGNPKDHKKKHGLKHNLKNQFDAKSKHVRNFWRLTGSLNIFFILEKFSTIQFTLIVVMNNRSIRTVNVEYAVLKVVIICKIKPLIHKNVALFGIIRNNLFPSY